MKRLLSLLLVIVMVIGVLASCGGSGDENTTTTAQTTTAATTEATTTGTIEKPPSTEKFDDFNPDVLTWSPRTAIYDNSGRTYTIHRDLTNRRISSEKRLTMTTFLQVNPGDSITLDSQKYGFIIYCYTDANGKYTNNSWIDVDPSKPINWGTSYTFTEDTCIGANGEGAKVKYPLYIRIVVKNLSDDSQPVPISIKDKFTFNITAENRHLRTENNVFDKTVFNPARVTWRESTVLDRRGNLADYGELGEYIIDLDAWGVAQDYLVADTIRMDVGDSIEITNKNYVFIPFLYDKNDNYLGYIDLDVGASSNDYAYKFVFTENLNYGVEGQGEKVEGPVYVKILVAAKKFGYHTVSEHIKNSFVFDIKTSQEPQNLDSTPSQKPEIPKVENNFDKDLVAWSIGLGYKDSTGDSYILHKNEYKEAKDEYVKVQDDNRFAMTSFLEVNAGDAISLDSDRYSFIIYGYSDKNGTYSANSWIDIGAGDKKTNWGNYYIFTEDSHYGKEGEGEKVQYPLYIRIAVKDVSLSEEAPATLEEIKQSFSFNISAENAHLKTEKGVFNENRVTWIGRALIEDDGTVGVLGDVDYCVISSAIKISAGDSIKLNSENHGFWLYVYDKDGNYIDWIDLDPANPDSDSGNEFVYSGSIRGGANASGAEITGPIYVRILAVGIPLGTTLATENTRNSFTFDIKTVQD